MTNEQINIAIAESAGYRWEKHAQGTCLYAPGGKIVHSHYGECWRVPDYCNDLNAIHEVEKTLNEKQTVFYMQRLSMVRCRAGVRGTIGTMLDRMVFATAQQRAEAYLRTIGKWKE